MSAERLMAQLDRARIVRYDADGYLLAWHGGHGVHVYYAEGTEVEFWNVGSFADNEASEDEVLLSMGEFMVGER